MSRKSTSNIYPDLERICRLCLKETNPESQVDIFASANSESAIGELSIPVRIMSCTALEVRATDGLPKSICKECRYQLEKSYYFRKRSQMADLKLRKHTRLLHLDKKSRVFAQTEDEIYEEELEFEESLQFIAEHDELFRKKEQQEQQSWKDSVIKEMEEEIVEYKRMLIKKAEEEQDLLKQELREEVLETVQAELRSTVWEEARTELREEIEVEVQDKLRPVWLEQAKAEVLDECRQEEREALLHELGNFLEEKRSSGAKHKSKQRTPQPNVKKEPVNITTRGMKTKRSNEMLLTKKANKLSASFSDNEVDCNASGVAELKSTTHQLGNSQTVEEDYESASDFYIVDTKADAEGNEDVIEEVAMSQSSVEQGDEDSYFGSEMETDNGQCELGTIEIDTKEVTSYEIAGIQPIQLVQRQTRNTSALQSKAERVNDENVMVFNIEQRMDAENLEMVELVSLEKCNLLVVETPTKSNKELVNDVKKPGFIKHIVKDATITNDETAAAEENSTPSAAVPRGTDTPKTFKCRSCPMAFSTQLSLDRHMGMHKKMEKKGVSYQCDECQIYVSCKSALTRHMLTHSGLRPHACTYCRKSFVQREILKRHLQTHTGERPHKCDYCDRSFTQKVNLAQHINKNHMAVPKVQQHSCHLCPKRFNHASGLSRHLASHSGVAFQCSECDRTFGDRSSVKRHISNVHGQTKMAIQLSNKDEDAADPKADVEEAQTSE